MQITQINNIYSLIAFIILIVVVIVVLIVIGVIIFKKVGKLSIKKGDVEVSIDNQKVVEKIIEKTNQEKRKNLREHTFFVEMEKWIKYDINKIKIENENKRIVIIEFLKIKFNVFQNLLKNYVINAETLINTNNDYRCDDIIEYFFLGIEEYNKIAREVEIRIGNRFIKGIPEVFINKFNDWHTPHIDLVVDSIKNIINNELYINEYIKLIAILEIFYIAFRLTVLDAMQTMNDLNGSFEKAIEEKLNGV